MAQKVKTNLTAHNMWKRHWRQSDLQDHPITEALTITSVNPLVMKGNACLVKQNVNAVERESALPKCAHNPQAGSLPKADCTPSNKPSRQTSCTQSDEAFTHPQCKETPQHSVEMDSTSCQRYNHAKRRIPNSFESKTVINRPHADPEESIQNIVNAVTQNSSIQSCSPSVNNTAFKCAERPSRLSCAGYTVLAIQQMTCQGQKMESKRESTPAVSGANAPKDAGPNALCSITMSVKPNAGKCSVNTNSSVSASMEHLTGISIKGSSALCVKNQQSPSTKHTFCEVVHEADNTPSDTLGKETSLKNASKCQLVSQYTSDGVNAGKHWVNPVSLTQAQLERQDPLKGQFLKSSSNITNCTAHLKKNRDVQIKWSNSHSVPIYLTVNKYASNQAKMKTLLTQTSHIKHDKEAAFGAVKNIPANLTVMGRSNNSTNPKADQAIREISQNNQMNEPVHTKHDHGNQVLRHNFSANYVSSEEPPSGRENTDTVRRSTLKNKSLTINYDDSKQNLVHHVKAKDISASEVKTRNANPTDSKSKPTDSNNVSGNINVPQSVTRNNSETSQIPANSVNLKSIPGKLADTRNNPVTLKKTFAIIPKPANTSFSPENMNRYSSLVDSKYTTSKSQEAESVGADTRDKEHSPKTCLETSPTPLRSLDTEQIPPDSEDAKCSSAEFGEAENIATSTDGNILVSRRMDTKHIQPNVLQSDHILPYSKQSQDAVTSNGSSIKVANAVNCPDQRSYACNEISAEIIVDKCSFEKQPDENVNTSVERENIERNQMRESDTNSVAAILEGSSNMSTNCAEIQDNSQNPLDIKDPAGVEDNGISSAKSDELKDMASEIPNIHDDPACELTTNSLHRKAVRCVQHEKPKVSEVKSREKSQSEINTISMHSDIKSCMGHSRHDLSHELVEENAECPSSGLHLLETFDNTIDASTENMSAAENCESIKTQRGMIHLHCDNAENRKNTGSDRAVLKKAPAEEGKTTTDSESISCTEDCSETNKTTNTAVEAKADSEVGERSVTNTAKTQPSPTHEDNQQRKIIRTTPTEKEPPKPQNINQCQAGNRLQHSRSSLSKQTESVCSQKLPRRTEGKTRTTIKPKDDPKSTDESSSNSAAAWVRVQSAQPQVFRTGARYASRTTQRRSKSVMDMAGSKEPASRCHCHRRLPGSAAISCQCNKKLEESSSEQQPTSDLGRQVKWFVMLWDQCQSQKTPEMALDVLKQMPRPQRHQLVREVDSLVPCSMLTTCCKAGHVPMVDFLLDECGVDIDRKESLACLNLKVLNILHTEEYHDTHSPTSPPTILKNVTALWCSAVEGHVRIVKTLVQHGADINAKSASGSSAIRSACYRLQVQVVEVLLKAGADVHSPNVDGVTCLMNGCNSPQLCHLLLRHGARPNDRDVSGNTALHYAAAVGQMQSLRLLLQYGGNVLDKNGAGNTVLRCAALRGWLHIVDFLAHCCSSVDIREVIEAYELAGSTLVDLNDDDQIFKEGILAWQKALHLRHIAGTPKNGLRQEKIAPFLFRLEFATQQELEQIASDREEVRIHALLVKERICGPKNEELIQAMMSRGTMCLEARLYRRCIDLWMHAFRLLLDPAGSLKKSDQFSPQRIVKLFLDLSEQRLKDEEDMEVLHVNDTLNLLQLLVDRLNRTLRHHQQQQTSASQSQGCIADIQQNSCLFSLDVDWGSYFFHLQMVLHLVRIISTFQELLPKDLQRFNELVYRLVKANHRSRSGESVLHLCFPLSEVEPGKDEYRLPTVQLLETLIRCGADVDAVNARGESPLFYIFTPSPGPGLPSFKFADKETWASVLLKYNAHVDRKTPGGRDVLRSLKRMDSFCFLCHVSLQCLAARVIREHEIQYRDPEILPSHLISFVNFH